MASHSDIGICNHCCSPRDSCGKIRTRSISTDARNTLPRVTKATTCSFSFLASAENACFPCTATLPCTCSNALCSHEQLKSPLTYRVSGGMYCTAGHSAVRHSIPHQAWVSFSTGDCISKQEHTTIGNRETADVHKKITPTQDLGPEQ